MRLALSLLLLWALLGTANAACISLTTGDELSFTGKLSHVVFPGPPNYESVEAGDSPEPTYLLSLNEQICVEDGGQFADPTMMFDTVQLFSTDQTLLADLKKLVGRAVTVSGSGFAAHTGHHHAPLVLEAESLSPQ